jgi:ribosomal protein S13
MSSCKIFETFFFPYVISQNYLVDLELGRVIQRDIKQLMSIGCYRGFRHNARY